MLNYQRVLFSILQWGETQHFPNIDEAAFLMRFHVFKWFLHPVAFVPYRKTDFFGIKTCQIIYNIPEYARIYQLNFKFIAQQLILITYGWFSLCHVIYVFQWGWSPPAVRHLDRPPHWPCGSRRRRRTFAPFLMTRSIKAIPSGKLTQLWKITIFNG